MSDFIFQQTFKTKNEGVFIHETFNKTIEPQLDTYAVVALTGEVLTVGHRVKTLNIDAHNLPFAS